MKVFLKFNWFFNFLTKKICHKMIMFSSGLDTNIKEIKKNGLPSIVITVLGVVVPLVFGFFVGWGIDRKFAAFVIVTLPSPLPFMLITTDKIKIPIISSKIAALKILLPTFPFNLPSSFKTSTVMPTEVAVSIIPKKTTSCGSVACRYAFRTNNWFY